MRAEADVYIRGIRKSRKFARTLAESPIKTALIQGGSQSVRAAQFYFGESSFSFEFENIVGDYKDYHWLLILILKLLYKRIGCSLNFTARFSECI